MKQLLMLLVLASCAPTPPLLKPVEVDIPIVTPCRLTPVTPPDFALDHVAPTENIFSKTRAALVDREQRKAFEAQLAAQLSLCP